MREVKRLHSNIARRIFLALLTALVPSYIIVLAINWGTLERVQSMAVESVRTEADRYMENLDGNLFQILSFQREHIDNLDFYKMVLDEDRIDNQRKTDIILNMQARLTIARSASSLVRDVFILVPALSCTIGSSSYRSSVDMGEFSHVGDYANFFGYNMTLLGERLLICLPLPDLVSVKQPPLYVTEVEIDKDALIDALESIEVYEGSSVILLNGQRQVMAANTQNKFILSDSVKRVAAAAAPEDGMVQVDKRGYHLGIHYSESMDMYLVTYMPRAGIDRMLTKYTVFFGLAILIVIVTIIAFTYWEYARLYRPLHMLLSAFSNTGTGKFEEIPHKPSDPFLYIYDRYNEMNQQLKELVEMVYEKKIQTQHAELRHLQSQINPHMLYNSFFTLYQMAKLNDMDNIMRFSRDLSRYYRLITRTGSIDILLCEEIENARLFAGINGILHYSSIKTEFQPLPDAVKNITVPKLIVQPLIENAYKHAMLTSKEGGCVKIRFSVGGNLLYITVSDNGVGMSKEGVEKLTAALEGGEKAQEDISGLMNVHRRLRLQYGEGCGLLIRSREEGGFEADVVLPLDGGPKNS